MIAMFTAPEPLEEESVMEDSAATVAVAFGLPAVRLELLRELATSGPATVSQLSRAVGWTRNGITAHLTALEAVGAVRHETVRVDGSFRPARLYHLEPSRVEELAWMMFDAIAEDVVASGAPLKAALR